jgi:hypothetical protein
MTADSSLDSESDPEPLAPKAITDRFADLNPGDRLMINGHDRTYEVVDTDTYAVIAEDSAGNRVTFSQNLQSGGWTLSENVFHVETEDG